MRVEEFPTDENYWLINWIDEYRAGHLITSSASVGVLLQRMDGVETVEAIWQMPHEAVQNMLGKPPGAAVARDDMEKPWRQVRVHAGHIPLLRIGQVYRNQTHVATLPVDCVSHSLTVAAGTQAIRSVVVSAPAVRPASWTAGNYLTLNNFELRYVSWLYRHSRCWVISSGNVDFFIPHQVVFQTFYAPHTTLARAFTNGPWSMTRHSVVHAEHLESGLLTKVDPETGAYHIILERGVPDGLARHVAMLYFDPFASSCANLIFTDAQADRNAIGDRSWFASAQFPYRPGESMHLQLTGYSLRGWKSSGVRQKVLITAISGARPPSYLPEIYWERVNSGLAGAEKIEVDEPAPYSAPAEGVERPGEHPGDDTNLTSRADSNAGSRPQKAYLETFSWFDAPALQKLKKSVSKVYTGRVEKELPEETDVSTGNDTNQQGAAGRLEASSIIRTPSERFEQLMDALDQLKASRVISEFRTVQPGEPNQIADRGGRVAWSVLTDAARRSGRWPKRGWRVLRPGTSLGQLGPRSVPRTVLIVEIEFQSNLIYWIEIECRETEGGYLSPVLSVGERLGNRALQDVVEQLAANEGKNLITGLKTWARIELNAELVAYKHHYANRINGPLDTASITRVLKRVTEE